MIEDGSYPFRFERQISFVKFCGQCNNCFVGKLDTQILWRGTSNIQDISNLSICKLQWCKSFWELIVFILWQFIFLFGFGWKVTTSVTIDKFTSDFVLGDLWSIWCLIHNRILHFPFDCHFEVLSSLSLFLSLDNKDFFFPSSLFFSLFNPSLLLFFKIISTISIQSTTNFSSMQSSLIHDIVGVFWMSCVIDKNHLCWTLCWWISSRCVTSSHCSHWVALVWNFFQKLPFHYDLEWQIISVSCICHLRACWSCHFHLLIKEWKGCQELLMQMVSVVFKQKTERYSQPKSLLDPKRRYWVAFAAFQVFCFWILKLWGYLIDFLKAFLSMLFILVVLLMIYLPDTNSSITIYCFGRLAKATPVCVEESQSFLFVFDIFIRIIQ